MTDLTQRLAWCDEGAHIFFEQLERLPDDAFEADSTLPGWTNAHLVAHLGYNARGLSRLVRWARTGEETPMYESMQARTEEIDDGAQLSPTELRTLAIEADQRLRADMAELTEWDAKVRTSRGATVSATAIPWMRAREVWIHAVDLGTGLEFGDFPADLVDALITDIARTRASRDEGPALVLRPDDREGEWRIGENGRVVRGSAAELCRWLAGRGSRQEPELASWL